MLRLPQFEFVTPASLEETIRALEVPGSRLLAGGTDLLPNLKQGLEQPGRLVNVADLADLGGIRVEPEALVVGAGVKLRALAEHAQVWEQAPSLAQAAASVASPPIRNMGTLGGNINLDPRCRYVNQTHFWRSAIGGCLKSEGEVCHVVPQGRTCVAALSSDCVPVLQSLGASALLEGPKGRRDVPFAAYFRADGCAPTVREPQEILLAVRVPRPPGPRRACYKKWSVRGSIDFPLVSLALCCDLDGVGFGARVRRLQAVVGVLGAKPRALRGLEAFQGSELRDPTLSEALAEAVFAQCRPLENVPFEAPYRRKRLRVLARRALEDLRRGEGSGDARSSR